MALIGRTLRPATGAANAPSPGNAVAVAPARSSESVEQQLAEAERCLEAGEAREGLAYARQALALARGEALPPSLFPRALLVMGSCERLTGEHGQSIAHLSEALRAFHELGDRPRQAEALVQLGQIQLEHGDHAHAVDLFLQALDAAEEAADVDLQARINRCLGMAASRLRDRGQARRFYQRALELQRRLDSPAALAASLNSLAVLELEAATEEAGGARPGGEQLEEAFALLEEALAIAVATGAARLQAQVLGNIGGAYALLNEPQRVIDYDERALALFRRFDAQREACVALANIGDARVALGQREQGLATLRESLAMAERHGFRGEQRRALLALSRAHETAGELGPALDCFKRYHEIDRQLRDAEAQQRVRQLALRHELDAAHREAARLREISSELARKNRALEAQADQLDRLAREDPLTGLGNRRALEQWFIRWSLDPAHGALPIALALLDIDHFKTINDRFSHSVGDAVLQAAADILRRHHRGSDVVVRYGGEEFVLVLPGTDLESAHAMCERLRVAIESHDWSSLREGLAVTASIGIAAGRAGEPLEALFEAADARLYQAKEAGRNQVRPRPDHVR